MDVPPGTSVLLVVPETYAALGRPLETADAVTVRTVEPADLDREQPDSRVDCFVVTDHVVDGLGFLASTHPSVDTVLVAFDGDEALAARAVEAGIDQYVVATGIEETSQDVAAAVADIVTTDYSGPEDHEQLVEYSSDIIAIYDRNGRITYINRTVRDVLGYEPDEVIGLDPLSLVHPDDRDAVASFFAALCENPDEIRRLTYRFESADGEYRTLESIGRNRLADPKLEGVVINSRDVTEREQRKAELELRESIIEVAPIGLHVLDEDGTFLWVNEAFASLFGRTPAEFEGTDYRNLIEAGYMPPDIAAWYEDALRQLLSSKIDVETVRKDASPVTTADGETRLFDTHLALLPLEDGEFAGTVTAFREVTERKEYEAELERQNERLAEFASVVSHDLRNPLSVASGQLALARAEDGDSDHLSSVADALDRMESLVDNILELAREGRVLGDREPVELAETARAAWETTATEDATLSVGDDLGPVTADPMRLQQLFENLYRNSVEHGGSAVTVTVGTAPDGFFVSDDGPGIGDTDGVALSDGAVGDGSGLGLSIVDTIATAHGWTVDVTESEDGGARFEFTGVDSSDLAVE